MDKRGRWRRSLSSVLAWAVIPLVDLLWSIEGRIEARHNRLGRR